MGKSGICKLSTLAILSGDVSNTSLSNCGNMRPHVTANPSSNCSMMKLAFIEGSTKPIKVQKGVKCRANTSKIISNFEGSPGCQLQMETMIS